MCIRDRFEVKDNIPYIVTGSEVCRRRKIRKRVRIPHVHDCVPNEGENSESESDSTSENVSLVGDDEQPLGQDGQGVPTPEQEQPSAPQGCIKKGHRRDRKADAKSSLHLCTHKPYNPNCDTCRRAKVKEAYKARGALDRLKDKYNPKK